MKLSFLRLLLVLASISPAMAQDFSVRITGLGAFAEEVDGMLIHDVIRPYEIFLSGDQHQIQTFPGTLFGGDEVVWELAQPMSGYFSANGVIAATEGTLRLSVANGVTGNALVSLGIAGGCPLCVDLLSFTVPTTVSFLNPGDGLRVTGALLTNWSGHWTPCVNHSPSDSCPLSLFDAFKIDQILSVQLAYPASAVPEADSTTLLLIGLFTFLMLAYHPGNEG
jgi:hypothetical protein